MKNGLKYLLLALAIILLQLNVFGQNIDSLKLALKKAKHDTTRCNILNTLAETASDDEWPVFNQKLKELAEKNLGNNSANRKVYLKHLAYALYNIGYLAHTNEDFIKALDYYHKSLKLRQEIADKKGIARLLNNIGVIYKDQGDNLNAIDCYQKSLKIREEIGDNKGIARSLINIGNIYSDLGDIPKALEYYQKGLKINEKIEEKQGISSSLNCIGTVYQSQGDIIKALEYYHKSLKIQEDIGDKELIANTLNNIGNIYSDEGDNPKGLEYYYKSLKIREENGDKQGIAASLINIGAIHKDQGDIQKTLAYYHKSLKLYEEIGYKHGIVISLYCIGEVLLEQGNVQQAFYYSNKSLFLSKELGYPDEIKTAAETLKKIYKKQNNYKKAFEMYELEMQMRDSINNQETQNASIKRQIQYTYEKKAALDSIAHVKENDIMNAEISARKAEINAKQNTQYALYGGLALVLVFAVFMVNRFRVTNKQKQIIELKEKETQQQNIIITQQKHLVEEKHKEITDSINYAERIQRSFLATKEILDANLNDYFVLFKPKDVVSGDFYWASILNNGNFALVTADSTGHGVPGAIMSLLNITSLEKAIEHLDNPYEILNHTRTTIINRLKKDGSEHGGKDGMDASLVVFDFKQNQLHIAAANNPVWIVRENNLIEVKPDKMPVGKHDKDSTPFTQQTIDIKKGDVIYAITDGYPDQFGGEKGKKFMSKNLKELLQASAHLPIDEQKVLLDTTFKNWVGNLEQVDDVTVIGIRI